MKNQIITIRLGKMLGLGCMLIMLGSASAAQAKAAVAQAKAVRTVVTLSDAEKASLAYMREEEKVARDVYLHLYDVWGAKVFANIASSEQTHMNTLGKVLAKYAVADPVAGLGEGEFANPELQELYEALALRGEASLAEAYAVGVLIEETDIEDLSAAFAGTTVKDVVTAYTNLRSASYKHLAAFKSYLATLAGQE